MRYGDRKSSYKGSIFLVSHHDHENTQRVPKSRRHRGLPPLQSESQEGFLPSSRPASSQILNLIIKLLVMASMIVGDVGLDVAAEIVAVVVDVLDITEQAWPHFS